MKAANETIELQNKLKDLYEKIVGSEITHVSVMLGQGWIIYVKSKPAANTISDLILDMNKEIKMSAKIEEIREEIDVLDDNGELIDIKLGRIEGYMITALFEK